VLPQFSHEPKHCCLCAFIIITSAKQTCNAVVSVCLLAGLLNMLQMNFHILEKVSFGTRNNQWPSQRGVWGFKPPPLKNVKKISEDKIVENTQS